LDKQDKRICKFDKVLAAHSVDLLNQSKKLEVLSNAMDNDHGLFAMRHIIYETKIKELQSYVLLLCTSSSMVVPSSPPPRLWPSIVLKQEFPLLQLKSRDMNQSQFVKYLGDLTLASDSLQDLELFFDGILTTFSTVLNIHSLFLVYIDLSMDFDFKEALCPSHMETHGNFPAMDRSYKAFGDGLHSFLLKVGTVATT